jgi:hypothetical protein
MTGIPNGRHPTAAGGAHNSRSSWIRVCVAMLYLGWAAWYSWPSWWPSAPASTFGGLLVAIPGFPWSFAVTALTRQTDPRLLLTCWLINASILYWYSGVWERWLRKRATGTR